LKKKVLVIDDDPSLGKILEAILQPLDLFVYQAFSGLEGLKYCYTIHPDLVILDIIMPGMDGFEVCSRLREFSDLPIMMLTCRVHESDMLHGFNVGANDYLKKPFSKAELEARVRALLRHAVPQNNHNSFVTAYRDSVLEIDLTTKTVKIIGEYVELSPKEYDLLACLVREQGTILSHRQLVREVWGELGINDPADESSLYIYYLRKKSKDGKYGHHYIRTLWGRGYWFEPKTVEETSRDEQDRKNFSK
jgi:two-component system, OmpR family, response regulator ArlR